MPGGALARAQALLHTPGHARRHACMTARAAARPSPPLPPPPPPARRQWHRRRVACRWAPRSSSEQPTGTEDEAAAADAVPSNSGSSGSSSNGSSSNGSNKQAPSTSPSQPAWGEASHVETEIFQVALPTLATLAADPLAGLVSTHFVGLLGTRPLASAGVALSLFNSSTKLLNMPLLAVTTSSVARAMGQEQAKPASSNSSSNGNGASAASHAALGSAVSAALTLALVTGAAQAAVLGTVGVRGLAAWGAGPGSALFPDAAAYLGMRALAAPATVLMLVLQGCFRGLGDTATPFYATVLANLLNVALEPLLIFVAGWGVAGAAAAVGLSQAAACAVLLAMLHRRCPLRLAGRESLARTLGYLKSTGLLALRTCAIMGAYSLATSLVARTDPARAASHQIAFQVWLASSLLADSLAVAAQTLLARSLAAGHRQAGQVVVRRTMQMALLLGCSLAAALALGQGSIAGAFSRDPAVLGALGLLMPAVILTQPLNALAFLMDGILYGVGGFKYAAAAMVAACLPAAAMMLSGPHLFSGLALGGPADAQLLAVWAGLGLLMLGRFLTIWWPLRRCSYPFEPLRAE